MNQESKETREPADRSALATALLAAERRNSRLLEYARRCFRQSRPDALTKAGNRMALLDRLPHWEWKYKPRVFAFIDVDNFKLLNDRDGHAAGDRALIGLAGLISNAVRRRDFACRFGGDEFLIVFSGILFESVWARLERIREEFLHLTESKVSLSIGVAVWLEGESFDSVLMRAETTMRQRKTQGKNGVLATLERGQ